MDCLSFDMKNRGPRKSPRKNTENAENSENTDGNNVENTENADDWPYDDWP